MSRRFLVPIPAVLLGALAAGCVTAPPRATADLARANTLINVAQQNGAQQFAGADLQRARDKLEQAQSLANRGHEDSAAQLASEAALDAELANARTEEGKQERSAQEVDASVASLRNELARGTQPLPPPPAPAATPPPDAVPPPAVPVNPPTQPQ
jgi:hypothetical protein